MQQKLKSLFTTSTTLIHNDLQSLQETQQKQKLKTANSALKVVLASLIEKDEQQLNAQLSAFNDQDLIKLSEDLLEKITQKEEIPAPQQPKKEVSTRQSKIAAPAQNRKTNNVKSESLVKSILGKFIKQDDTAKPMILPDKQPQCVYDPKTKTWIIEGQEQEKKKEKTLPPPPKSKGSTVTKISKKPVSQIDALIAPPKYKRKGGSKKKNQNEQTQQKEEIKNFGMFINNFMKEMTNLQITVLDLLKENTQFEPKISKETNDVLDNQISSHFIDLVNSSIDTFNTNFEEITTFQQQIMNKIIIPKQLPDLSSIHQEIINMQTVSSKILESLSCTTTQIVDRSLSKAQALNIDSYRNKVQQLKEQTNKYTELLSLSRRESQKIQDQYQSLQQKYHRDIQKLNHNSHELCEKYLGEIQMLRQRLQHKENDLQKYESLYQEKNIESQKYLGQLSALQRQINGLNEQEQTWNIIYEGLKEHLSVSNLNKQISQTLIAQTDLLRKIQQQRHNINSQKNTPSNSNLNDSMSKDSDSQSDKYIILSDTLNSIVSNFSDKLLTAQNNIEYLQQRLTFTQNQLSKSKQSTSKESQSFQRTIQRLKSLNETYKQCIEESNNKVMNLQQHIQQLNSKINSLKKDSQGYKKMLENNIRESQENSRLHKQQLSRELDELTFKYESKVQEVQILEKQMTEVSEQLKEALQRIVKIDKKDTEQYKQIDRLKMAEAELQELIETMQQENQQKNQQIDRIHKQEIENLKHQLQQEMQNTESRYKQNIQALQVALKEAQYNVETMEQYQSNIQQLKDLADQKQQENSELLELLDAANTQGQNFKIRISQLEQQLLNVQKMTQQLQTAKHKYHIDIVRLQQTVKSQQQQISQYSDEISQQISISEMLTSQLLTHKQQLTKSEMQTMDKITKLSEKLSESEDCKEILVNQLKEYENLVNSTLVRMKEYEQQSKEQINVEFKEEFEGLKGMVEQKQREIERNQENLELLTQELAAKENQVSELELKILTNDKLNQEKSLMLTQQNKQLKDTISTQQGYKQKIETQLSASAQKYKELQAQFLTLRSQSDANVIKIGELQELLLTLQDQKSAIDQQLNTKNLQIIDLNAQLQVLNQQISQIKPVQVEPDQSETQKIKEEMGDLLLVVQQLQKDKEETEKNLQTSIKEITLQLDNEKRQHQSLKQHHQENDVLIMNLKADNSDLRQACKEIVMKIFFLVKYIEKLKHKCQLQQEKLEKLKRSSDSAEELTQLQQLLLQQEKTLQQTTKNCEDLQTAKQQSEKQYITIKQQYEVTDRKLKQAQKNIEAMQENLRQSKKWENDYKKIEAQYSKLELEALELQNDKKSLMEQKQQLAAKVFGQNQQNVGTAKEKTVTQKVQTPGSKGNKQIEKQANKNNQNVGFFASFFLTSKETQKLTTNDVKI